MSLMLSFDCRIKMVDLVEVKFGKVLNGDSKFNLWTLFDFGMFFDVFFRNRYKYDDYDIK